jgi:hypothetical protein
MLSDAGAAEIVGFAGGSGSARAAITASATSPT